MNAEMPMWRKSTAEQPYREDEVAIVARNLILDFWEIYSNYADGDQFRKNYDDFVEKFDRQKKPEGQLHIETTITIAGYDHHISFMAERGQQKGQYPDTMKLVVYKDSSKTDERPIAEISYSHANALNERGEIIKRGLLLDKGDQTWLSVNTPLTVMKIREEFGIPLLTFSRAHPKPDISER